VNEREPLDDQVLLCRASEAKGDVGFSPGEVDIQVGALQLELDLGVTFAEATKLRSDESRREHFGGCQPDHALELLVFACHVALDAQRFPFDSFCAGQ
jgi:hypothetical protein